MRQGHVTRRRPFHWTTTPIMHQGNMADFRSAIPAVSLSPLPTKGGGRAAAPLGRREDQSGYFLRGGGGAVGNPKFCGGGAMVGGGVGTWNLRWERDRTPNSSGGTLWPPKPDGGSNFSINPPNLSLKNNPKCSKLAANKHFLFAFSTLVFLPLICR